MTAAARSFPATSATPKATTQPVVAADAWPFNLKLLLFVLVVFTGNIAAVLYLAQQMPT
jgi:hypothetical protein